MIEFTLNKIKKNGDPERLMEWTMKLIADEVSCGVLNDGYNEITWHTRDEED